MKDQAPIVLKLSSQKKFAELCNEHHIDGIFYHYYHHAECLNQYKKQWIHNQVLLQELELVALQAKKHETSATVLKGAHLLLDLYTDLGSRFMSDIDLLISPQNSQRFGFILHELGYTPLVQKTFHGNHFKQEWCKSIGEVEINIEVHTQLFFHLKNETWVKTSTTFPSLDQLRHEDLFIHLCGHLAFQHTFLKLYWLFDIYFMFLKFGHELDWKLLKTQSLEHKLFRSTQMCLWILREHFGLILDPLISELFEIDQKHWWQKFLTLDFLIYPEAKKWTYFLIKHATKDHLSSALLYDLAWFYHYKLRALWTKQ